MAFVLQQPQELDPFAASRQAMLGGIQEFTEQDALSQLTSKIRQGEDPMQAVLNSRLPAGRQRELISGFQKQQEIGVKEREERRKRESDALIESLSGLSPSTVPIDPVSPEESRFIREPSTIGSQSQSAQQGIQSIPQKRLDALQGHSDPRIRALGKAETDRRKEERKTFVEDREFESKRALPFLKKVDEERENIRNRDFSGKQILSAIEDGDTGFFSPDNLAQVTGVGAFRTAKGQQLITAGKEYFLSNINRAGTRPNQWIEQQIQQAMPRIGTSKFAQATAAKTLIAGNELDKKRLQLIDDLTEQYQRELGYVPGNIASIVDKAMIPVADEIQANLSYDLRKIFEEEQGKKTLIKNSGKKVSRGTPLTPTMATIFIEKNKGDKAKAISQAKRLGYTIPTVDQLTRYENDG